MVALHDEFGVVPDDLDDAVGVQPALQDRIVRMEGDDVTDRNVFRGDWFDEDV